MKMFSNMKKNKKGGLQEALYGLLVLGVFLVVVGFTLAFGADFLATKQSSYITNTVGCNSTAVTSCGYAYNVSRDSLTAMTTVANGQGTVSTVGILVIIVGLLVGVIGALGFAGKKETF